MFAEPVKKGQVNEQFRVLCIDKGGNSTILSHLDIGIQNSSYQYTLRNIYYSKKEKEFTDQLFKTKCNSCDTLTIQTSIDNKNFKTLKSFSNEH